MRDDGAVVDVPPLSARSTVISLLLGSHPARLSAAQLVALGEQVGVGAATLRVALTRGVAAGDLRRDGTTYALGERHAARRRRLDEAVLDAEKPWDGTWESAVVVTSGRPASERAALRELLTQHRLAELREGVWMRPANLERRADFAGHRDIVVLTASAADPADLTRRLWDLSAWADQGRALAQRLSAAADPADRLATAAAVVRHLATDPMLPDDLLPRDWPGALLRERYAAYAAHLRAQRVLAPGPSETPRAALSSDLRSGE